MERDQGNINKSDILCKFCLDSENKEFISPCLCTGSAGFVHVSCLKTWISSQEVSVQNPKCEICSFEYKMQKTLIKVYNPKKAIEEEFLYCCMIPVLILISIFLIIIIIVLSLSNLDFDKEPTSSYLILGICSIPLIFSFVFLIVCFNKILYIKEVKDWRIYSINDTSSFSNFLISNNSFK